jgi:hypothetical protein
MTRWPAICLTDSVGSAGPGAWLGDGDPLGDPLVDPAGRGEGALDAWAGPGPERSHSGKRPATALAASATAKASARIAVPTRSQNCLLSMPLREPVAMADPAVARSRAQ